MTATLAGSTSPRNAFDFKVVLLGEGCVGKTSLVLRYVENKFNERHESTLQASFLNKKLNIGGKRINLAIWDTAGQERFHALGPIYYRDSQGALLVYDITDEDSFQKMAKRFFIVRNARALHRYLSSPTALANMQVKNWVKELRKQLGEEISLVIVGNKVDLERQRNVPVATAEEYAASVGARHFQTSAKQNKGVEELFLDLSRRMLEQAEKNGAKRGAASGASRSPTGGVVLLDESAAPPAKSGCC